MYRSTPTKRVAHSSQSDSDKSVSLDSVFWSYPLHLTFRAVKWLCYKKFMSIPQLICCSSWHSSKVNCACAIWNPLNKMSGYTPECVPNIFMHSCLAIIIWVKFYYMYYTHHKSLRFLYFIIIDKRFSAPLSPMWLCSRLCKHNCSIMECSSNLLVLSRFKMAACTYGIGTRAQNM